MGRGWRFAFAAFLPQTHSRSDGRRSPQRGTRQHSGSVLFKTAVITAMRCLRYGDAMPEGDGVSWTGPRRRGHPPRKVRKPEQAVEFSH